MKYGDFIAQALEEASKVARESFGKVAGTVKAGDNNQVLTETDLAIGRLLIEKIQGQFPEHNIIDEEAGVIDKQSSFTWVIDPIDGTSNFANGVPLYGIMLGLMENNSPIAGGLALPSFAEIYVAEKGEGAFCNDKKISIFSDGNLKNALVSYGIDGHPEKPEFTREECALLAEIVLNIRNLRTSNSVFDAAMVMKGAYGAYANRTSKVWDNVAQQIIIEEAGGIYTDFFGNKIDYSNALLQPQDNYTFLAAPPALYAQLLKIISSH
ncbi:inositol monophosphatase [Patescibacteria group bacterium]|nr:MAG: inositol monophosphatase [Patescibacteria group bacterium]